MDWQGARFDWNRARAFLVTAEHGSFSAAARALQTTQPTIGRQVAALEEELGVSLFERVANRLVLTQVGLDLVEQAREMGAAAMRMSLTATGQATSIEGTVSITAGEAVAAMLLPPLLQTLRHEHPGIDIDIVASNEERDLHRREADIAIRNFQPKQPDLIARKLGDAHAGLYATAAYLDSIGPLTQDNFSQAELLAFDRTDVMITGFEALGLSVTRSQFPIMTGNHLVQWEYCKRDLGICVMMEVIGDVEPAVVRVLPEFVIPVPMWIVSHRELRTSRRIRLVFDLIADTLSELFADGSKPDR